MAELRDAWGQIRLVVRDASSIGDDRVLARVRLETHGRTSGLALEGDLYYCFWLRHGRFFRAEDHLTAEVARRALGLRRDARGRPLSGVVLVPRGSVVAGRPSGIRKGKP
jgi:hypothetical protein